eukprot:CAMPEP_0182858030 /NCGR_PEP_ID=MMETSP0034_2-20130328/3417_1 /TAXON_ID=156128 /ORGANISM="Nephroselmis pyriformis, Strain CCMP717" /LENGTH=915 /DNA_ID=CAMNT_0024989369 /DNA_START=433 /DNA_END=3177 /DNA_ORIENTATION=+
MPVLSISKGQADAPVESQAPGASNRGNGGPGIDTDERDKAAAALMSEWGVGHSPRRSQPPPLEHVGKSDEVVPAAVPYSQESTVGGQKAWKRAKLKLNAVKVFDPHLRGLTGGQAVGDRPQTPRSLQKRLSMVGTPPAASDDAKPTNLFKRLSTGVAGPGDSKAWKAKGLSLSAIKRLGLGLIKTSAPSGTESTVASPATTSRSSIMGATPTSSKKSILSQPNTPSNASKSTTHGTPTPAEAEEEADPAAQSMGWKRARMKMGVLRAFGGVAAIRNLGDEGGQEPAGGAGGAAAAAPGSSADEEVEDEEMTETQKEVARLKAMLAEQMKREQAQSKSESSSFSTDRPTTTGPIVPRTGLELWAVASRRVRMMVKLANGFKKPVSSLNDDEIAEVAKTAVVAEADSGLSDFGRKHGFMSVYRLAKKGAQWRMRVAAGTVPKLSPFMPKMLLEEIADRASSFQPSLGGDSEYSKKDGGHTDIEPRMATYQAAIMVADISGFTPLTERLSKRGTAGVELLTKCMNNFFSQVMTLVEEYGGDVMKFAGDSMICAFFVDAEERQHPDGGLRACTLRATQCADRLVGDLGSMRMLPDGEVVPEENGLPVNPKWVGVEVIRSTRFANGEADAASSAVPTSPEATMTRTGSMSSLLSLGRGGSHKEGSGGSPSAVHPPHAEEGSRRWKKVKSTMSVMSAFNSIVGLGRRAKRGSLGGSNDGTTPELEAGDSFSSDGVPNVSHLDGSPAKSDAGRGAGERSGNARQRAGPGTVSVLRRSRTVNLKIGGANHGMPQVDDPGTASASLNNVSMPKEGLFPTASMPEETLVVPMDSAAASGSAAAAAAAAAAAGSPPPLARVASSSPSSGEDPFAVPTISDSPVLSEGPGARGRAGPAPMWADRGRSPAPVAEGMLHPYHDVSRSAG